MVVIHPTQNFIEELRQDHSMEPLVQQKLQELTHRREIKINQTNLRCYDRGGGIWVLKLRGKGQNSRILMQEIYDTGANGKHQLFIVRRYYSQRDYDRRWRNKDELYAERGEFPDRYPLDAEEKAAALRAFAERTAPRKTPKPYLPGELYEWLENFSVDHLFTVYESNHWRVSASELKTCGQALFDLIRQLIHQPAQMAITSIEHPHRQIGMVDNERVQLVFEETDIVEESQVWKSSNSAAKKTFPVLLLHNWAPIGEEERLRGILQQCRDYEPLQQITDGRYRRSDISRGALRGYPALVFKEENGARYWFAMQQHSRKSNLALSREQTELLAAFPFPLFLNGQAGSGKSEILMYLFAHIYFLQRLEAFTGEPLFLTENEELLKQARRETMEKINFNSQYHELEDLQAEPLGQYFSTFRDFLIRQFFSGEEIKTDRFPESKYVNFHRFEQLYEASYLPGHYKRKYSAELAWFVINAFIRGYDQEREELPPDAFASILSKDQTYLEASVYREIFDNAWRRFYQPMLEKEGYWDRLQLVRKVMKRYNRLPPEKKRTVIVCDEAQDLTKVELRFLIQLSRYTDYNLSGFERVPIILAGDPFQTVNPTGFNLKQVKRLFSEEIAAVSGIQLKGDDLVETLEYNYRSAPEIVNLANLVQYVRFRYLRHSELNKPQSARRLRTGQLPQLLSFEAAEHEELADKLQNDVLIVPCNNGGEEDYQSAHPWLQPFIVKSASRAKGSEYPTVTLYHFGEEFVRDFGPRFLEELMDDEEMFNGLRPGERFRLAFFFNKLYVAITRAQEALRILDTETGVRGFWNHFRKHPALLRLPADWAGVEATRAYHWQGVDQLAAADFKQALMNAEMAREQGSVQGDAERMEEAAQWYAKVAGHEDDAQYCRAMAAEFAGRWQEAGKRYRQCRASYFPKGRNPVSEASRCYWIGGCWSELLELHADAEPSLYRRRRLIARIMIGEAIDPQTVIHYGAKLQESISGDPDLHHRIEWKNDFYPQLIRQLRAQEDRLEGRFAALAEALDGYQDPPGALTNWIAELYFRAGQYAAAHRRWQEAEHTEHRKYWIAGERATNDPNERLYFLQRMGETKRILELYPEVADQLDGERLQLVQQLLYQSTAVTAFTELTHNRLRSWRETLKLLLEDEEPDRMTRFFGAAAQFVLAAPPAADGPEIRIAMARLALQYLERHENRLAGSLQINLNGQRRESRRQELSRQLQRDDYRWVHELMHHTLRLLANAPGDPATLADAFELPVFNYLRYAGGLITSMLDGLELAACIDRCCLTLSRKQQLYTKVPNFLLRNNLLPNTYRYIIEERFWKIRYAINARETNDRKALLSELHHTFERFGEDLPLQRTSIAEEDLRLFAHLPDTPSVAELRQRAASFHLTEDQATPVDPHQRIKALERENAWLRKENANLWKRIRRLE